MKPHRCSIHCVVPPIVLDRIARNGNQEQRDWALDTLARDQSVRAARLQGAVQRGIVSKALDAFWSQEGGSPNRTIYDAKGTENVAGTIARREGDSAANDEAVDEAYDGLGDTYRCLWEVFERHSLDDAGMPLNAVVHFGQNYDNAFWDGQRMVFGDGDGSLFTRFTRSLDVIGHELGHGVVEDEAGLNYWQQSGALNESMADVLGTLVKQFKLGQTVEEADWLVGAEILGPDVEGKALRSLEAPGTAYDDDVLGKDPQPAHMDDYVEHELRQWRRPHQLRHSESRFLHRRDCTWRALLGACRVDLVRGAPRSARQADCPIYDLREGNHAGREALVRRCR